jgi:hypothetical protein
MAVVAPSSGVVALEKEMIDARGDAALIHMLPVEMLLMVFAWVDTETLLRAVHAVCRSWRMAMSSMYVSRPPLNLSPLRIHCIRCIALTHSHPIDPPLCEPSPEHVRLCSAVQDTHLFIAHILTLPSPSRCHPGAGWRST